eukprot:7902194-Pyramimonas_sp.AAC.1
MVASVSPAQCTHARYVAQSTRCKLRGATIGVMHPTRCSLRGAIYVAQGGATCVVQATRCKLCGVANVAQRMRCNTWGALYAVLPTWCNMCGAIYAVQVAEGRGGVVGAYWCNLRGAIHMHKTGLGTANAHACNIQWCGHKKIYACARARRLGNVALG